MENFLINKVYSRHFRKRMGKIEYVIIHSSAFKIEKNVEIFDELGVSAHYLVGRDGKIIELVNPRNVAFHAGKSSWKDKNEGSLNEYSIGIELEAPNLGQKRSDFSKKEMEALCFLLEKLKKRYGIKKENVLGHSDIAVERKPDPGVMFPWKELEKSGFGVWFDKRKLAKSADEVWLLERIGYECKNLCAARYAFCRHFVKSEIEIKKNITQLLDNPYIKNFCPKDENNYLKTLRAVCYSYCNCK